MIRHRKQRGVALIFALGILSLILVMGVAFLGNALIGQKIALNSRETASARLVARSALDRAMTQLVLFNLTQCGQLASSYLSPEASSVFSRIGAGAATPLGGAQGDAKDQLAGDDSKLNVGPVDMRFYPGMRSRARWICVHRNGAETDGQQTDQTANPIIARYAYQVLPPIARNTTSFSRNSLSLYAVTSGADGVAGVNSNADDRRKAQTHRWGIDADELCISDLSMFSGHWTASSSSIWSPQHEFDNFQNLLSGTSGTNPFYWNKTDTDAKKLVESRKRWLRYVFTEGRGRTAREAFSDGSGVWYTRFNLSDGTPFYDANEDSKGNWYSRLLTEKPASASAEANMINGGGSVTDPLKNSAAAVENLARFPDPFKDGFYYDKDGIDNDNPSFSLGIPFLKRVGSSTEKGAFETVDNLRKQIAANLNDYCDSDSVPTSNVAASTWGGLINQTDSTKLPSYTGNEKTLCINEVAFGFRLHKSKLEVDGGKCIFKPSTSSWGTKGEKLRAELIVELVEPYKGLPDTYKTMRLEGRLNNVKLQLKASIKGKVKVRRSGEEVDDDVDLGDGIEATTTVTLENPGPFPNGRTFTISSFTRSGGYWVGRQDLNEYTKVFHVDFTDAIKTKDGKGKDITVTSVSDVTHIKAEVLGVTFDLGNLALYLKDKDDSPTVDNYVDFVRVTHGERVTAPGSDSPLRIFPTEEVDSDGWLEKSKLSTLTATDSGKCFFYGGSMQAIDPRQNLFAKLGNTQDNDWYNTFTPALGGVSAPAGTPNWDSLDNRKIGAKNEYSDPGAPKYADGTTRPVSSCDAETATDPAWLGDGVNEHISTAVIRNRPMRSPWELGFIHRGIPFQTINLKKAGGINDTATLADDAHKPANFGSWESETGTKYEYGDAGILDEIKMTEYKKSFGKIDVSTLISAKPPWWVGPDSGTETFEKHNEALFKALFRNIRAGQKAEDFLTESASLSTVTGTLTGTKLNDSDMPSGLPSASTSVNLRSKFFNEQQSTFKTDADDDARQEELIGKTVNLIDANSCSPGSVYWIVIVAQTIRDVEGTGTLGKFDVTFPEDASDPEKNVYTDEILGECRMLVTVEKISYLEGADKVPRVKLLVRQIEYLD